MLILIAKIRDYFVSISGLQLAGQQISYLGIQELLKVSASKAWGLKKKKK